MDIYQKYDPLTIHKMAFLYNAVNTGWTVEKKSEPKLLKWNTNTLKTHDLAAIAQPCRKNMC